VTADVAIITCITDGYEVLKPAIPQYGVGKVEWICVTDGQPHPDYEWTRGWTMIKEPRHHLNPNRAAKWPKCMPWEYTDAPASVWIDGSYRVVSSTFVSDALSLADPIAQFVHPWRDCLFEETQASALLSKYDGEPVLEQAAHYQKQGFPQHWGLWASGVIARRHTQEVKDFGRLWLSEILHWSFQDQISEPYALNVSGLRPTALPGDHLTNPWLHYEGSARH
jgi:Protein of unknown function (DUF616)